MPDQSPVVATAAPINDRFEDEVHEVRELRQQEEAEVLGLREREEAEVRAVRERFEAEVRAVRERFDRLVRTNPTRLQHERMLDDGCRH